MMTLPICCLCRAHKPEEPPKDDKRQKHGVCAPCVDDLNEIGLQYEAFSELSVMESECLLCKKSQRLRQIILQVKKSKSRNRHAPNFATMATN
jgi:hypothetical protein